VFLGFVGPGIDSSLSRGSKIIGLAFLQFFANRPNTTNVINKPILVGFLKGLCLKAQLNIFWEL
jgi:hypothetical protein